MTDSNTQEWLKSVLDALSIVTVVGAIVEILPAIAALFTIIWTGIRILETDTVKGIWARLKNGGS